MEQITGLVWETERPVYDIIRKTPNFWLLGYEWNISLELYFLSLPGKPYYKITLRKLADDRPLDKYLNITYYIRGNTSDSCVNGIKSFKTREQVILCRDVESANKVLGSETLRAKWTITFIFHSEQPLMLHLSKKETGLASSESVTDTQVSSGSNDKNLSKAILSEDKCVQACSDIPPDLESLSSDFHKLLEREIFPDVKLRCEDRNICVHRSILAARSDVFTAMFRNKMAESETGTIDITDVDAEVLDLLLKYVYSGKIPDLSDETASSLYEAGDKYSIHALKKSCSDWMVRNLATENCLGYLVVADAHSDEDFKERVVDFVAENLKSIKKDAWSKFNKDHALLAISVYQRHLAPTLAEQA